MSNKHHPCRLKNVPDQKENIGNVLKSTSVPTSFIKDHSVLIKGIDGWKSDEHFQQNYFYGFIVEGGEKCDWNALAKICRIAECQLFTEVFRPVLKLYNMWEYRREQMTIQYHYTFSDS